jgi:hypothetical protein
MATRKWLDRRDPARGSGTIPLLAPMANRAQPRVATIATPACLTMDEERAFV